MSNYVHNIDIFIIPYLRGKYNRARHIFVGFLSYFCIRKEDILSNVLVGSGDDLPYRAVSSQVLSAC